MNKVNQELLQETQKWLVSFTIGNRRCDRQILHCDHQHEQYSSAKSSLKTVIVT